MPIYEFRCRHCRKKTTSLVLTRARVHEVRCRHCGSADLEKLVSRFATLTSDEDRLDALATSPAMSDVDEQDPASMARWMKKLGREMGEDFGDDVDQAMEEGTDDPPGSDDA
jgi:putative FmdB family regulatory protein